MPVTTRRRRGGSGSGAAPAAAGAAAEEGSDDGGESSQQAAAAAAAAPRSGRKRRGTHSMNKPLEEEKHDASSASSPHAPKIADAKDVTMVSSSSSASSSSSSENDVSVASEGGTQTNSETPKQKQKHIIGNSSSYGHPSGDGSKLYYPFHTLGLITSRHKFHLQNHGISSDTSFVTVPLGDRFHVYKCDGLRCVMVGEGLPKSDSRSTPGRSSVTSNVNNNKSGTPEVMSHVVSDASLQVALCVHGPKTKRPTTVTLYRRTGAIRTTSLYGRSKIRNGWGVCDVIQLGKVKVDAGKIDAQKDGKTENALLVALVCSREDDEEDGAAHDGEGGGSHHRRIGRDGVEIVGDDDDASDDDDDSYVENIEEDDDATSDESGASSSSEDEEESGHRGEIVLLVATRSGLQIKRRLQISTLPNFVPSIGVHPSTYVNKVVLAGTDRSSNRMKMILLNIRSGKVVHDFKCLTKHSERNEVITAMEQSPAVDTIAIGTSLGHVHLVNLRHDVKLFTLHHSRRTKVGVVPVKVTALSFRTDGGAQRQGLAPLAVGRGDGDVSVWDLTPRDSEDDDGEGFGGRKKMSPIKEAQRTLLTTLSQLHRGGVSHLTYLPNEPLLLSSGTRSNSLVMTIFDSPDHSGRPLRSRVGHSAPPGVIRYLHPGSMGGGILANASDGTDASSCQILSAGGPRDRTLRVFSTARSVLDKEYSQGKGLTKRARELGLEDRTELLLPEIVSFTTCEARSRDWGDLVTIHRDHAMAYVWSTRRGAQSGPVLRQSNWNVSAMKPPPPVRCHATSVCISSCGNFVLVGTKGGVIYRYNIQSGIGRGSYPRDATAGENKAKGTGSGVAGSLDRTMRILEKKMRVDGIAALEDGDDDDDEEKAARSRMEERRKARLLLARHGGAAVTGLAVDALNKTVISVGADAKLILWSFVKQAPHRKSPIYLPSPATKLRHVRDSDLAAIALEDYSVLVFDCEALRVVRRFSLPDKAPTPSLTSPSVQSSPRHNGPITDLSFSPGGRRLLTASLDNTIRVWDVPTATCVDWMRFSTAPTSVTLSPTGEYMATTHINKVGLGLWCDRSFFQTVHLDGGRILSKPARMNDPVPLAEDDESEESKETDLAAAFSVDSQNEAEFDDADSADGSRVTPKSEGLVTMSGLPPAHWKNLFHLELVKERNKPKEAPQKPVQAPFFLQFRAGESVLGGRDKGDIDAASGEAKGASDEKEMEGWDAAWSDDEQQGDSMKETSEIDVSTSSKQASSRIDKASDITSKAVTAPQHTSRISTWSAKESSQEVGKRRRMTHHRSHLASLLVQCHGSSTNAGSGTKYDEVTEYVATLGPSAIDIALSTLCQGMHDLEDGLHLLYIASLWLLEAITSRRNYEAVNAYLHRFLTLHSAVIANIDGDTQHRGLKGSGDGMMDSSANIEQSRADLLDAVSKLRISQREADEKLRGKMQNTLCLLRHFSRMV